MLTQTLTHATTGDGRVSAEIRSRLAAPACRSAVWQRCCIPSRRGRWHSPPDWYRRRTPRAPFGVSVLGGRAPCRRHRVGQRRTQGSPAGDQHGCPDHPGDHSLHMLGGHDGHRAARNRSRSGPGPSQSAAAAGRAVRRCPAARRRDHAGPAGDRDHCGAGRPPGVARRRHRQTTARLRAAGPQFAGQAGSGTHARRGTRSPNARPRPATTCRGGAARRGPGRSAGP